MDCVPRLSAAQVPASLVEEVYQGVYAVIETGGKQYKVSQGDVIRVEKLAAEPNQEVVFDKVLLVGEGAEVRIGNPVVAGAQVRGRVLGHDKAKKILVFRYKPKKNQRVRRGHRQPFTAVLIESVNA